MKEPRISMIVALDIKGGMGKSGTIPWHIPGEQARFRTITMGHPVIMGRITYESIPEKYRPLPGRANCIVSSNPSYQPDGAFVFSSFESALSYAKTLEQDEIFIIGGGQLFKYALSITNRLYLTRIYKNFGADVFFPDYSAFTKVIAQESHQLDGLRFEYVTLEKPN